MVAAISWTSKITTVEPATYPGVVAVSKVNVPTVGPAPDWEYAKCGVIQVYPPGAGTNVGVLAAPETGDVGVFRIWFGVITPEPSTGAGKKHTFPV